MPSTEVVPSIEKKSRPEPIQGSYGEAIRTELLEIEKYGAKKKQIEQNIIRLNHNLNIGLGLGDELGYKRAQYVQTQIDKLKEELAEISKTYDERIRAAISAPDNLKKNNKTIKYTTNLKSDDGRVSAMNTGTDLLGDVLSARVAPAQLVIKLAARVPDANSSRARYINGLNVMELMPKDGGNIAAHELGHWLEDWSSYFKELAHQYYKERTGNEPLKKLGGRYNDDEMTREDGFIDPYIGKDYMVGGVREYTEIISMGLQYLSEDPIKFAKGDKHYFDFIIAVLHGKL